MTHVAILTTLVNTVEPGFTKRKPRIFFAGLSILANPCVIKANDIINKETFLMTTHPTLDATVERTIAASPEKLYAIMTDITRIGELSPECTSAEWIGGSAGPEVGARFKGTNELGTTSWSTKPRVTAAEPGRVFEFKVPMSFGPRWRYEFHPVANGTRVVETVSQAKPSPWFIRRAQKKQGVTDRVADVTAGMRQTLENLEAIASA